HDARRRHVQRAGRNPCRHPAERGDTRLTRTTLFTPREDLMLKNRILAAALAAGFVTPALAEVQLANVAELSGAGAAAGTLWAEGVRMAVAELNAAGGILGEQIALSEYDTQTDP